MSAAHVAVSDVTHGYGAGTVLHAISLEVAPGESLALLGPSGCGKTTLLRTIAGLERPDTGTINIGDRCVASASQWIPPEKRRVGMVFQDWALFPHLSVARNVAYGLHGSKSDVSTRVGRSLELVELSGLEDRAPATLSGGQQQRVALARALAPEPDVLLLDEPFSNLDTSLRIEVRSEVHRLVHELGITAIFVTHDQEEAFLVGDRVAVMHGGVIAQHDTPRAIYTRPANRWVADFVGAGSFLRGTAIRNEVHSPIGVLPLDCDAAVDADSQASLTGQVDALVRPEQLHLVPGQSATVTGVEFYGHDLMVGVDIDGQRLTVRSGADDPVQTGDAVSVAFIGSAVTAFASEPPG